MIFKDLPALGSLILLLSGSRPLRTAAGTSEPPRLVLGLDGVICADAEEIATAACRAAFQLWPDVMNTADDITLNEAGVRQSWVDYDWQKLLEHKASMFTDAPPWLLYKLQKLRPACQAGWEMLLFARLCVEEAVACRANRAKGRGGARPLTIGEIECNWLGAPGEFGLRELLLMRWGNLSITQLQEAMADARRQNRSEGVLVQTQFYSDVLRVVWLAAAAGTIHESVHIVTSRDQVSTISALQHASEGAVDLPFDPPDFQGSWADREGWQLHCGLGTVEEKVESVVSLSQAAGATSGVAWIKMKNYHPLIVPYPACYSVIA